MDDFAGGDAAGGELPEVFDADAVGLRVAGGRVGLGAVAIDAGEQLLGERAARAFGEDSDLGAKVISGLEVGFGLVVLVEAFVVGADAEDLRAAGDAAFAPGGGVASLAGGG